MATKAKRKERAVLVGKNSYGLYVGLTTDTHAEIVASKAITLRECRHVRYWYGRKGGITSLAAHGPCGPRVAESRIGAPVPGASLITDVGNVFDLSPEAVQAFASIVVPNA